MRQGGREVRQQRTSKHALYPRYIYLRYTYLRYIYLRHIYLRYIYLRTERTAAKIADDKKGFRGWFVFCFFVGGEKKNQAYIPSVTENLSINLFSVTDIRDNTEIDRPNSRTDDPPIALRRRIYGVLN